MSVSKMLHTRYFERTQTLKIRGNVAVVSILNTAYSNTLLTVYIANIWISNSSL